MQARYLAPAVFFLMLQILLCIVLLPDPATRSVLVWYCNSVPLFLGLAFLFGRIQIVKGLVDVGIVVQLMWVVDLLVHLLFGAGVFHITDYVFASGWSPQNVVTVFVHLTTPLVALWWSHRIAPRYVSFVYSCVFIAALYFATITLTPDSDNINYIFRGTADLQGILSPLNAVFASGAYFVIWPLGMVLLSGIGYAAQALLYRITATRNVRQKM